MRNIVFLNKLEDFNPGFYNTCLFLWYYQHLFLDETIYIYPVYVILISKAKFMNIFFSYFTVPMLPQKEDTILIKKRLRCQVSKFRLEVFYKVR